MAILDRIFTNANSILKYTTKLYIFNSKKLIKFVQVLVRILWRFSSLSSARSITAGRYLRKEMLSSLLWHLVENYLFIEWQPYRIHLDIKLTFNPHAELIMLNAIVHAWQQLEIKSKHYLLALHQDKFNYNPSKLQRIILLP